MNAQPLHTTRTAVGRRLLPAAGLAVLALSACAPALTADGYELANIDPANIVPKSSPASFVATFETFCVPGILDPAALPGHLRAADYVEVPARGKNTFRTFVVDDRRPAVSFAATASGIFCGVTAESRTGQTERVQTSVAKNFPAARPVSPSAISPNAERAWQTANGNPRAIFTLRLSRGASPATLTYAIFRPT